MAGREIVLDTETTGLDRRKDRIVEIAAIEIFDLMPTGSSYHCFANPGIPVHPEALRVHGLTDEFLRTKAPLRKSIGAFLEFIGDAPLVIHNAPFDVGMINAELVRFDLARLTNPIVDTLEISKAQRPGKKHSLDVLARHFKVKKLAERVKHGAMIDVEILAEVYAGLRGGLQMTLDVIAATGQEPEAPALPFRPARDFPGPTLDELAAHLEFVRSLGPSPVWGQYIDLADVDDDELAF
jgi:DNA polymerase-3 subunit epsilon